MNKAKGNRFYCAKKMCRKTAWDTPEYMEKADWDFLTKLIPRLEVGNAEKVHNLFLKHIIVGTTTADFFDRVIGWPEGFVYCADIQYFKTTGIGCLQKQLPLLKGALGLHLRKAVV